MDMSPKTFAFHPRDQWNWLKAAKRKFRQKFINFPFNKMEKFICRFELKEEVNYEIVNLRFAVPIIIILCLQ